MSSVAFLCLGVMGYPMAGHLARAGHDVAVYNRTRARADAWLREHEEGGSRVGATPAEAARGAEFVFVCTGNDDDLRRVALADDGALAGMSAGAVFVDHTTVSPTLARELFDVGAEKGLQCLDAPVSGGQAGAENGVLTVMVGGEPEAYARVEPLIASFAKKQLLMGRAGSGQLTKAVNQICIAGLVQALSEGLHFAKRSGLDAERVVEVISQGAAQSWQMDNRAPTMLEGEFDFGFAVDWMRKDLGIALSEARKTGAKLPVTALVDEFYAELQSRGGGRLDTSSLIKLLE
jgi:3-hydroxyisobutyrate dehydrogenase-like beta-hydroxyacid dehydrogenase